MGKKCILISECQVGDIIAQKIVSKYGGTVAVENTTINAYIIKKLIAFEIECLWVYDSTIEENFALADNSYINLKKNYKHNIIEITTIINDLSKGKSIDEKRISSVVNSIFSSLNEEFYIIKCLNELKNTDQYLYNHSINVSFYGMLLSKWLGLSKFEIKEVLEAGLLHDIGKVKIPLNILNKREKLDIQEFDEIKKHPIYGYNLVKDVNIFSEKVKDAILTHHERVNKSGYPMKKSGEELNVYAKIVSIVDAYDAITSERVYSKKRTPFEAFQILMNDDLGCFDIHVLSVFLSNLAACYVGCKVLLNTNEIGEVVYVPPHAITKPIICIDQRYIDLSKETDMKIVSML